MLTPERRRHLQYALRRGTWAHLGRRLSWRASSSPPASPTPLSWPLSPELRTGLRIRWPGRYGQPNAAGWVDPIKTGIAGHVSLEHTEIVQPVGNVVVFEALMGRRMARIAIDYDDQMSLNDSAGEVELYFKMQYRRDGYGTDRIRPAGYVTKQPALYRHARRWRSLRERTAPCHDVLGRFGMQWAQGIRGQALAALSAQDRFGFTGGAVALWWGEYMDELCRARVCLDLPGRGEFCYRLVEYLAVGACVVGPELRTEMPVPLQSGLHLVRVDRSLQGLVDACERLVRDADARRRIQQSAADYFDRYLTLPQLGAYHLDAIWSHLERT